MDTRTILVVEDSPDDEEILMQKSFGDKASLNFRKFKDEEVISSDEPHDMQVGFEYRLRSKDSLKMEFRDQEQFVGVERKMKF